jgi:hypothetical protein
MLRARSLVTAHEVGAVRDELGEVSTAFTRSP